MPFNSHTMFAASSIKAFWLTLRQSSPELIEGLVLRSRPARVAHQIVTPRGAGLSMTKSFSCSPLVCHFCLVKKISTGLSNANLIVCHETS
ncbi:MAG TPA: hypothetical protein PKL48_14570, partial [Thermodesulfobacteriota bacterium]|nr:hypothetical protein [Thermodesulfobacteriota bacterium]